MQVPRRVRERDAASGDDRSYSYGRITLETVGSPSPAKDVINGGDNTTATDKEIKQVPPNNKNDSRIAVKRRLPDPGPVAACHSPGKKSKQLEENATDSHKAQNNKAKDCEDKSTQLTVRSKGKDRHSKVKTAKGLRDRRVRLSAPTAIQFFDVQDRLGFDQPSKAVDWLLKKAKEAIDELTLLQQQQQQQHLLKIETVQTVEENKDKEDATDTTHLDEQITTPTSEKESLLKSPVKSPVNKLENQKNSSADAGDQEKDRAGSRAKARERARERANLNKGKDSFAAKAAANTAKEGLSKCKDEHGINLVVDAPNVKAPTKDIEVVSSIMEAQYTCPLPLLMQQQQLDISNDNTITATNTIGHVTPYSELNHHLLLKQQQAMQASLFSYLLSNAPYDASAMASQGNNSNNNRPWPEVQPMINNDNCDGAAALAFHQSKRSLLIPALQGVAGCPANPNACCNGKSNIEEREKANAMYSHMLVGHYEADSTMTQTALISPYNQTPPPILPPPPPAHQGSQKNNEKMAVQRMMMASNNSTSTTSSFEQQVSPGHGSTVWSNYNSIGLPYNHPSSSTGGTLQSIFSPAYSSSNSHQQLLVFTTSGGQTPSSSLSSASSGVFNRNMSTCTTTPSTWVHAGSMADDQMEGADTGLPPPHAANSWSHR